MDIIAWNIQGGGGSRMNDIESELIRRQPDVIVLGEYVHGRSERLINNLSVAGWIHHVIPNPPKSRGGVAIVSRLPLEPRTAPTTMSESFRYAAVGIPCIGLELRGIYAPLNDDPYHDFWNALLDSLSAESEKQVLLLGDLNAALPKIDTPSTTSLFSTK